MKRGWRGIETETTKRYEKFVKLDGRKYRIEIDMLPGKDVSLKSVRIERDPLEYMEMPGKMYSSSVSEKLGTVIRPMNAKEVKDMIWTVYFAFDDFPRARINGRRGDKNYLTELRVRITADELTNLREYVMEHLDEDWEKYRDTALRRKGL